MAVIDNSLVPFDSEWRLVCPVCGCSEIMLGGFQPPDTFNRKTDTKLVFKAECGTTFMITIGDIHAYRKSGEFDSMAAFFRVAGSCEDVENDINYKKYIASPEWRLKANEAKSRAGHRCQVCNKPSSQVTLDAHHRTYERLGNELPEDITVLCRKCHGIYHRKGQI